MLPVTSNFFPSVARFFDEDFNTLFDYSNRNFSNRHSTLPSVNVRENKDQFVVEVAAPGMSKEDFDIELANNVLTIRGERKMENSDQDDEGNYTRQEFSYQSFQRTFNLNNKVVDDASINASYQDGILYLTLPKKEEAKEKPARRIEIN